MWNKIKSLFFKNLYFKFLSLILALILWIIAIKINNPVISKKYSVNLDLLNLKIY